MGASKYVYTPCMSGSLWNSEEGIVSVKLELQTVVSYPVGAKNPTWFS